MSLLHTHHRLVLKWARENEFGEPCGCDGMCAHQRFSAGDPTREVSAIARHMHDARGISVLPFVRYYFWVGAVPDACSLDALGEKLSPLVEALRGCGANISLQCMRRCGVEFTPTRLPCQAISLILSEAPGLETCKICGLSPAQHRWPEEPFPN